MSMRSTCTPSPFSTKIKPSSSFQKCLLDNILSTHCGVMMPCYELSKCSSYNDACDHRHGHNKKRPVESSAISVDK